MNINFTTKLRSSSSEALALPFHNLLPKDKVNLLRWRIYTRQRCLTDREFRSMILQMCKTDVAFFVSTFIYLHETRPIVGSPLGKFPFFPESDQVDILAWLAKYLGRIDITIEKTRGIGLSYLICVVLLWLWLFHGEKIEFALVSKDEQSLDLLGRPSSLFGKLDLLFAELPAWMKIDDNGRSILRRTQTKHRFEHEINGNAIIGFVPTDEKLRSGRYFCVVLDEAAFFPADSLRWFASAHGVTNSIVYISTHCGAANFFYILTQNDDPEINVVRISTYWQASPRCAAGMYISKNGKIELLDPTYKYPLDYTFSHDLPDIERSPLIDAWFARPGADAHIIFEELYGITAVGSRRLFPDALLDPAKTTCVPALYRGFVNDEGEFVENLFNGPVRLWIAPDAFTGCYTIGCDPSLGVTDGAFAGITAIDAHTGQQVLAAAMEDCEPISFARLAVGIAKLLSGPRGAGFARIAFESTGVGIGFSNEIKRLRWPAVFQEGNKTTPGIHNADRGEKLLIELGRAIRDGEIVLRDGATVNDLAGFEYDRKGDLLWSGIEGHADLAQAIALAWWAVRERRRAILHAKKPKNDTRQPIEQEPEMIKRVRNRGNYSARFKLVG